MKRKTSNRSKPFKVYATIISVLLALAVLLFFVPWALNARDTVTNAAGVLTLFTIVYSGCYTMFVLYKK